ncbi:MAG: hypothetical protein PHQ02_05630 [Candidatus Riflebacteria bacterium]|nr:hypothetical protein [Candidatus Riflebacteria bacterium]
MVNINKIRQLKKIHRFLNIFCLERHKNIIKGTANTNTTESFMQNVKEAKSSEAFNEAFARFGMLLHS